MSALRAGDYYVVAVDDMEPEEWRDPVVLDRLRSTAVRVNVPEGATADVPLPRINFNEGISKRWVFSLWLPALAGRIPSAPRVQRWKWLDVVLAITGNEPSKPTAE